jgi:serpin B
MQSNSVVLIVVVAIALIGAAAFLVFHQSGDDNTETNTDPEPFNPVNDPVAFGDMNSFAWAVFDDEKNVNKIFSPYGIYTALGMLLNGAEPGSSTEAELVKLLGTTNATDLNAYLLSLTAQMAKMDSDDLRFTSSNLVLVDSSMLKEPGVTINENFARIIEECYDGNIDEADFANDIAAVKLFIQEWVAKKTNNMIPEYDSIANNDTVTDILNAVSLKAKWANLFEAQNTHKGVFKNCDGTSSNVDLMTQLMRHAVRYYEDSKYRGIELPYTLDSGYNTVLAMYIVIPQSGTGMLDSWSKESVEYREAFLESIRKAEPTSVKVTMPKFEMEASMDLKAVLKSLGLSVSFTNEARFTKMIDNEFLKVDAAKHQAKIKVDEEGTEAAAVTEITMVKATGMLEDSYITFNCNVPFVYTISLTSDGTSLFMGSVGKL